MDNWKKHFIILEQVEIEKCAAWRDRKRGCQHHCVDRVCSLEKRNGVERWKVDEKGRRGNGGRHLYTNFKLHKICWMDIVIFLETID